MENRMGKIAIAGATGFVGQHLLPKLAQQRCQLLARSEPKLISPLHEWRKTDLFSVHSTTQALAGAEIAIYLVHSMLPSSRLFQGKFHDTDLLLADNFSRACVANGVRQIIFLGGLVPQGHLSDHLRSRREVEEVFESSGIPFTIFRAGMLVGPGGSSFEILKNLVENLPLMVLPHWTRNNSQAVYVEDAVDAIRLAIDNPQFLGRTFSVVNGERITYRELLQQMGEVLGKSRRMVPVPMRSVAFSKFWVSLFGRSTYDLVSPLLDSLLCNLPYEPTPPELVPVVRHRTFREMATVTLDHYQERRVHRRTRPKHGNTVRSIQRLPTLTRGDCVWLAAEYMAWLPRYFFQFFFQVRTATDKIYFHMLRLPWPLLVLQIQSTAEDHSRQKFFIVGGLLSRTSNTGWLEFRQVAHRKFTLAAIQEFIPALPWPIYVFTQARMHLFVMRKFTEHVERRMSRSARKPTELV